MVSTGVMSRPFTPAAARGKPGKATGHRPVQYFNCERCMHTDMLQPYVHLKHADQLQLDNKSILTDLSAAVRGEADQRQHDRSETLIARRHVEV